MSKVAILVDGGFYKKRAKYLFGDKDAKDRVNELLAYCHEHLNHKEYDNELYRIYYYDCPPYDKAVFHPFLEKNISLKKTPLYTWNTEFLEELKCKRKVALRLGMLSDISARYQLKADVQRNLFNGKKDFSDICQNDFEFSIEQKGVDMKIGLDISSIAYKKLADRIILISADSDFVPAAKLARREGIDFILDPMWADIKPQLNEHIDGLQSLWGRTAKKINRLTTLLDKE